MTDQEVRALKPGDVIRDYSWGEPGRFQIWTIRQIIYGGDCINTRSGAFGHAYAGLACPFGAHAEVHFSVESDEYITGSGYETHAAGIRRIGVEMAPPGTIDPHAAA